MNTPAWLIKQKETPSDVMALYKQAKVNNCWIFDSRTNNFYTPKEFIENWSSIFSQDKKGRSNLNDLSLKYPYVAIKHRTELVAKATAELQAVLKKLEDYNAEFKPKK